MQVLKNNIMMAREISPDRFAAMRDVRALHPDRIADAYRHRRRRPLLRDGRLFILAVDHPARGALGVGGAKAAMADRYDLLSRLVLALSRPGVDGVLATADILDDLALLGVVDDKVLVGSSNRSGLQGAQFEMDDRVTAHTVESVATQGLDVVKVLLRINLRDAHSVKTMVSTAGLVSMAAAASIPVMIEPFMSEWRDGVAVNMLTADAVIKSVAIASGLGTSSAYTWLKLPVVPDMARVMRATTLPTLLLGGDLNEKPEATYRNWADALGLPGVRGLVVGRTLLYPADDDVAHAVDMAAALVHGPTTVAH